MTFEDDERYEEYLKHAWKLYYDAIASEGVLRQSKLRDAAHVLELVPSDYKNRDDLWERVHDLL